MKTFIQWCEEKQLPVDVPQGQDTTDEHRVRTGLSQNYPDAYVRGQYPHKYFNPTKGTADLDIEQPPSKKYGGQKAAE